MKSKTKNKHLFVFIYEYTSLAPTTHTCEADKHGVMRALLAVCLWNISVTKQSYNLFIEMTYSQCLTYFKMVFVMHKGDQDAPRVTPCLTKLRVWFA